MFICVGITGMHGWCVLGYRSPLLDGFPLHKDFLTCSILPSFHLALSGFLGQAATPSLALGETKQLPICAFLSKQMNWLLLQD